MFLTCSLFYAFFDKEFLANLLEPRYWRNSKKEK